MIAKKVDKTTLEILVVLAATISDIVDLLAVDILPECECEDGDDG